MKTLIALIRKEVIAESCPFCDSDDLKLASAGGNDSRVCCNNCEAQGPVAEDAVSPWNAALHKVQKRVNELTASIETLETTVSTMQKVATLPAVDSFESSSIINP